MMRSYFEDMAASIEAKLAAASPGEPVARKRLALETARLGARLYSGELMAWCGVLVPFEVLHAFGIAACFVEFVGATLAGTGQAGPFIDAAEQAGYPSDACTFHRTVGGAMLQGLMPTPAVLVGTTCPCAGGTALIENMARHFDKPLFMLDIPYGRDERDHRYVADQLEAMVRFITDHTGRPLDRDRLRHVINLSNQARAALVEMYELTKSVPSPARRRDLVNLAFVIGLSLGTEAAIEIAVTYRDELAERVKNGIGGSGQERYRLLWVQNRIQFRTELEEMLERDYGASIVVDELNSITSGPIDPDDPFPGLARRMLTTPLAGDLDRRILALRRLARDYRVDGAIHPCHWGCRQGTGGRGLFARGFLEAGIPMLSLEVDCIDQRNFSEGQLRTRVQAFMEMLAERQTATAAR
jgi:benzoyl-CoA reductase/2-hydroxyglutaryl-CoA dehydratase subunit BcrC/BadD/HgdB